MWEVVSVAIWHLQQICPSIEEPVLQGFFYGCYLFSCTFLVVHIASERAEELVIISEPCSLLHDALQLGFDGPEEPSLPS
jgi:hypothetical protein